MCYAFDFTGCFKGDLDLSKQVIWVSVGQRAAKVKVVNVENLKKVLPRTMRWQPRFETWKMGLFSKFERRQLSAL